MLSPAVSNLLSYSTWGKLVEAYFKLSISNLWYGNVIWRHKDTFYQVQQSTVKYSSYFQAADWKKKWVDMWFFVSRSCIILYRIMKFQTPKLEKKYNIFNNFWRFFFFFLVEVVSELTQLKHKTVAWNKMKSNFIKVFSFF